MKIFHVPTVQKQTMSLIRGRGAGNASTACLMFAIYYATIAAMSAEACRHEFEEDRTTLLKRCRFLMLYCRHTKPIH